MATERFANAAQTTLGGALTNSATSLTVASAAAFPNDAQFRVRVDSELMLVTAVAGTTWTVTRGVEGTTATGHATGARVTQVLTAGAVAALVGAVVPTGTVSAFTGLAVPTGWLLCNGASVSRTTYADLFATLAVVLTGTTTSGSPTVTVSTSTALISAGLKATAVSGIPAGAVVTGKTSNTVTLGANATANGSRVITFSVYGAVDTDNFYLPDFQGRALIGAGTGSGLTARSLGEQLGEEAHQLVVAEMPSHSHTDIIPAGTSGSGIGYVLSLTSVNNGYQPVTSTGGDAAHNNIQPSAVVKWIVKT